MKFTATLGLALATCYLPTAIAGPSDYIYEPAVEYHEKEIDYKYGYADQRSPTDDLRAATSLGFGYGATPRWFTEFYIKGEDTAPDGFHYDAVEWENRFQLTETGEYPVDLGFVTEIERPEDHAEGWEVRMGALFQTQLARVQTNLNLLLTHNFDAATPEPTQFGYQVQIKYRWKPVLEFGIQGFGDMGKWDRWASADSQSQRFGPALFGKIGMGAHKALRYNTAFLFGTTTGAPGQTLRLQVEYEF